MPSLKALKARARKRGDTAEVNLITALERRASKKRYQMGYSDGSGSDDTIYDVKLGKPIAVVSWGCSCCKTSSPEDTKMGQLIVDALNKTKPKKYTKDWEYVFEVLMEIAPNVSQRHLVDRLCEIQGFLRHGKHDK